MKHNICPLTGQPCCKPKIYQITEIEDNKAKAVISLCEDCFAVYVNQPAKVDAAKEAANKFVNEVMSLVETVVKGYTLKPSSKKACPKCKATLHDIAQTGKLGCNECWDFFYEDIKQALYASHGSFNSPEDLIHVGKIPKNYHAPTKEEEDSKQRMVKLKYKLSQAIEQEDYEKAAKIRDIIKDLESMTP